MAGMPPALNTSGRPEGQGGGTRAGRLLPGPPPPRLPRRPGRSARLSRSSPGSLAGAYAWYSTLFVVLRRREHRGHSSRGGSLPPARRRCWSSSPFRTSGSGRAARRRLRADPPGRQRAPRGRAASIPTPAWTTGDQAPHTSGWSCSFGALHHPLLSSCGTDPTVGSDWPDDAVGARRPGRRAATSDTRQTSSWELSCDMPDRKLESWWPSPAWTATTAGRRSSPARSATPAWRSSTPGCTRPRR